jgi:hypothetical protein
MCLDPTGRIIPDDALDSRVISVFRDNTEPRKTLEEALRHPLHTHGWQKREVIMEVRGAACDSALISCRGTESWVV